MKLTGSVESIVFSNSQNGYSVISMEVDGREITVVGTLPTLTVGASLEVEGEFVSHAKFGSQFLVKKYKIVNPTTNDGLVKFLGNGLIKGVGPKTAQAIVEKFGNKTLEIVENNPNLLATVKGVSKSKAMDITTAYQDIKVMQEQIMFLQGYDMTTNMALRIYNVYKQETKSQLNTNPYKLVDDVDGIGFLTADKIAQSVGIESDSVFRVRAGVVYCLKETSEKSGNTFLFDDQLFESVKKLLAIADMDVLQKKYAEVLDSLQLETVVNVLQVKGQKAVALSKYSFVEKAIADRLIRIQHQAYDFEQGNEEFLARYEKANNILLHEGQRQAVLNSMKNGVSVITGGPGTGKTTIVKCILNLMLSQGLTVELCSPTGRASKRLSSSCGKEAKTIHRMLGVEFVGNRLQFAYNEYNPLQCDALIVDEVSMVDCVVFNSLLKAVKRGCHIILVGDKDQLPSVGAGNVLGDIISCNLFNINYLTHIYRQDSKSLIVSNAHLINSGKMPEFNNKSIDFFHVDCENTETAQQVVQLVTQRLPSFTNVGSVDIQVLSPLKSGSSGVESLNRLLQEQLNPWNRSKPQFAVGSQTFRLGDKVMQTQNDYQLEWTKNRGVVEFGKGVFNGDIGFIEKINAEEGSVEIAFEDGRVAYYAVGDLNNISLAYAITVHKSQGSEFDVVVIPLYGGSPTILNKNLLYTAVTRAKKVVVLVGGKKYINMMVRNNQMVMRNTLLDFYLKIENKKFHTYFGEESNAQM